MIEDVLPLVYQVYPKPLTQEQHQVRLPAYRVRAASGGSLITAGSRTVNVDPSP